jgi:hypothetical protein
MRLNDTCPTCHGGVFVVRINVEDQAGGRPFTLVAPQAACVDAGCAIFKVQNHDMLVRKHLDI